SAGSNLGYPGEQLVPPLEAPPHLAEGEASRQLILTRLACLLLFLGPRPRLSVEHGEHLLHRRAPSAKQKIPLFLCRHAVPPPLCQMHARHLKNRLHAGCRTLSVWCPLAI